MNLPLAPPLQLSDDALARIHAKTEVLERLIREEISPEVARGYISRIKGKAA